MIVLPVHCRGFTLIELVVVLFIMGLVMGFLMIRTPHLSHYELQNKTQEIISVIRLARERAIVQNQLIKLNVSAQQLQFSTVVNNDVGQDTEIPLGGEDSFWQVSVPSGFIFTLQRNVDAFNNQPPIYFWPTGEASPFQLQLKDTSENVTINVSGQGNVQLSSGQSA